MLTMPNTSWKKLVSEENAGDGVKTAFQKVARAVWLRLEVNKAAEGYGTSFELTLLMPLVPCVVAVDDVDVQLFSTFTLLLDRHCLSVVNVIDYAKSEEQLGKQNANEIQNVMKIDSVEMNTIIV